MDKKSGSRIRIRDEQPGSELRNNYLVKIFNAEPGWKNFWIRDPELKTG
jgi:hypothetical protein